jgi:uncharacterized protein YaiI (UPF0178 family)
VKIKLTLVANQSLRIPRSEFIDTVLVRDGPTSRTDELSSWRRLATWSLLQTFRSRPMLSQKARRQSIPRGGLYTHANIGERLAMRNVLDQLRGGGISAAAPPISAPKTDKRSQTARSLAG